LLLCACDLLLLLGCFAALQERCCMMMVLPNMVPTAEKTEGAAASSGREVLSITQVAYRTTVH
jgi:hypothetical protein